MGSLLSAVVTGCECECSYLHDFTQRQIASEVSGSFGYRLKTHSIVILNCPQVCFLISPRGSGNSKPRDPDSLYTGEVLL